MKQFEHLDIGLLKKYSTPGPRYTSYPTAPVFSPEFGPEAYRQEILDTNSSSERSPISLYFHFPFCDTLCYFCGCTMKVTRSREQIAEYNEYLKKEIDLVSPMIASGRRVVQLHWGGGTPSYLTPGEILDIGGYIRERFRFDSEIEASVEIDPRGLTKEHLEALREVGFNRMSMGVQDYDEKVQQAVNRIQPESMTREVVRWGRELGFESINLDLMYGLPFQSVEEYTKTVETTIALSPDRIAVFNYAHVPWLKPHQKLIDETTLPTADIKLEIFKMAVEKLTGNGYWNIGMDHFAKPDDELSHAQQNHTLYRNFQGYSTKAGCDVYGFGMSAIGQFKNSYHQNEKEIKKYSTAIRQGKFATHVGYRMTPDDHIRKSVIMEIMCHMELSKLKIEHEHHLVFDDYFAAGLKKLRPLIEDGLVSIEGDLIRVEGIGRLVVRNIAMCFDGYIDSQMGNKPIFSKTV